MNPKAYRFVISLVILGLVLAACSAPSAAPSPVPSLPSTTKPGGPQAVQPISGMPTGTDGYPWWNDAVFYEIFVRSFYDSNSDGIGDFNGITAKLDYLNDGDPATTTDLGITGLWLMPIHPSPSYHGYDVTDYYAVNPDYGTLEDFQRLLDEAHRRGIRVTIDLVLNHTSSYHPWFEDARKSKESPYRDWYIFSETDPGYTGAWGQDVWAFSSTGYYFAAFWSGMPDLNYNNPEVVEEMNKVAKYWLDLGVDGFRLDAARYLIEEGKQTADTPSNHAYWEQFRLHYKAINPDAITIGEVWTGNTSVAKYVEGDELDIAFNFDLSDLIIGQVSARLVPALRMGIEQTVKDMPHAQYATFLANHDQNRLMNQLSNDPDKVKTAAALLLTLPGVPFIYYGEEIGLVGAKPDEDIRKPMQWSTGKNAGFSSVFPWRTVNQDYLKGVNVAAQQTDPASLWSHYHGLIQLRNQHAALRVGSYQTVAVSGQNLQMLAFLRQSEQETLLVLVNLSKNPAANYQLQLKSGALSGSYLAYGLFGVAEGSALPELVTNAQGGFDAYQPPLEIPGNGAVIIQLASK